jgi:hypothetical protein
MSELIVFFDPELVDRKNSPNPVFGYDVEATRIDNPSHFACRSQLKSKVSSRLVHRMKEFHLVNIVNQMQER